MKKYTSFLLMAFAVVLFSCQSTTHGDTDPTLPQFTIENQVPEANDSLPVAAEVQGSQPPLNPPHGQPGHDCNIPVGDPLDGSGSVAPASAHPQVLSSPGASPRLNPPHGQPGHICEIAVGQPLP